jgi:hypothetical protein
MVKCTYVLMVLNTLQDGNNGTQFYNRQGNFLNRLYKYSLYLKKLKDFFSDNYNKFVKVT